MIRSKAAPVSRSLPNTSVQFSNGKFVVSTTLVRSYSAEEGERSNMPLQERLQALAWERLAVHRVRMRQAHHEHSSLDRHSADDRLREPEIDLSLNRIISDGVWTYTFDDAGQLVEKIDGSGNTWTYEYDHRGQMVSAELRDGSSVLQGTVTYEYDAFGNRIERIETDGTLTVMADDRYGFDGWDTTKPPAVGTEDFDIWVDLDSSNAVTARRMFGPGVDQPVAKFEGGSVSWYGTDRQGSVRSVFDNSGSTTLTFAYDAFGNVIVGALTDRYGYTGREFDAATGLWDFRARMYDSNTGLFTSEDSLGFGGGQVNLFVYVGNGATNSTDPSGLADNAIDLSIPPHIEEQIPILPGHIASSNIRRAIAALRWHEEFGRPIMPSILSGKGTIQPPLLNDLLPHMQKEIKDLGLRRPPEFDRNGDLAKGLYDAEREIARINGQLHKWDEVVICSNANENNSDRLEWQVTQNRAKIKYTGYYLIKWMEHREKLYEQIRRRLWLVHDIARNLEDPSKIKAIIAILEARLMVSEGPLLVPSKSSFKGLAFSKTGSNVAQPAKSSGLTTIELGGSLGSRPTAATVEQAQYLRGKIASLFTDPKFVSRLDRYFGVKPNPIEPLTDSIMRNVALSP